MTDPDKTEPGIKERYTAAEERTDAILASLIKSPLSLAVLAITHLLAFLIGAIVL